MSSKAAWRVQITRSDGALDPPVWLTSGQALRDLVVRLGGAADLTLEVYDNDKGTLLIGVDGGRAIASWDGPDGLQQCAWSSAREGRGILLIGGQPTDIDAQYVFTVEEIADAALGWIQDRSPLSGAAWQRC